ncbi:MFS transporter [Amycolatopsis sacchari]|uniref:MFS transporter n=1 Tax=Amycolatopsis sacchari TaxID=115433 RepID=UPI003D7355B9
MNSPTVVVSSSRRPVAGFVAICVGYFAIILDGSVLNVAVPAIRADLGSSMAGAQWVLNGYTLTLAALLLTAGALGDRLGLRRAFLAGVVVFTAASVSCALAPSTAVLVGARVVQGLGAAALLPATLALIPHLFPDREDQARAAVVWVATGAISMALGPLVGGLLIDLLGWRSIFLLNVPVGVVSVALAWTAVAETPRRRRRLDVPGQLTAVAALGLVTAGVICSGSAGWGAPLTLGLLGAGLVAGAGFWIAEHRGSEPMLPPEFFAHRVRTVAVTSAALMGFLFYGTLFVMSLYFQQLRGWSPGAAGVALLPMTVGSTIGPLALYRPLSRRFGHPVMLVAGFCCCALGIATLAWTGPHTAYAYLAVGLLLTGMSSTVAFSALTSLLVASTPADEAGLASGVQNTTRQAGALMSVAILGSVLNGASFAGRLPVAFAVLAVVVAGAIALAGYGKRASGR